MKEETKPIKIECEVYWANLKKPNEMSGKYQVDLCALSNKAVAALEELGIEARKNPKKPEQGFFVTAKSNHPIKIYDQDGTELDVTVGNGSKAKAVVSTYEWAFKNKKGVSVSLKKLTIAELKTYNPDGQDEDEEDFL